MRPLTENTPERQIGQNTWALQRQEFMPGAFFWRTPDVDDDPPTPPLENTWAQPSVASGLERWAYRLNANGELEFKGHLDMSDGAAFDTVATTLHEPVTDDDMEPSYRTSRGRSEQYIVSVTTTGGLDGVQPARATVDPDTGEVTIHEIGGGTIEWVRAYRTTNLVRSSGGSQSVVDFDEWEMCAPSGALVPLDTGLAPADPGETIRRVRLEGAGRYSIFFGAIASISAAGPVELAMHDGDDTWGFPDVVYHSVHPSFGGGFLVFQLERIYPILDPFGGTNDTPEVSFTVAQVTGASITFNPCWLEVHYEPACLP